MIASPGIHSINSNYISQRAGREFWFFTIATFLCSLPRSMFSMLSVILTDLNTPTDRIGLILSSLIIPILICSLISGIIVAIYGPKFSLLIGTGIMLTSFLSMELTIYSDLGLAISLICFGVGFGLFMPPAMIYAKSRLSPRRLLYLFGIYSSMFPIPNMIGPTLAEAYLEYFGLPLFFIIMAIPLLISLVIVAFLTDIKPDKALEGSASYFQLLISSDLRIPFLGVFTVGLIFGLVTSFMALILTQNNVSVTYFFTSFTLAMLISRFTLMRYAHYLPREIILAGGFGLTSISYIAITLHPSAVLVLIIGILFGIGHSAAYPTLSVWCSDQFLPEDRGRPIALFNTLFSLGIYLTPVMGGMLIGSIGLNNLPIPFALVGLFFMGVLLIRFIKRRLSSSIQQASKFTS